MKNLSQLFDQIAPVYDKVNGILSLNRHKKWNRTLAERLKPHLTKKSRIIDLCAGTGAITKELLSLPVKPEKITLVDLSSGMLEIAKKSLKGPLEFVLADALDLPFEKGAFDCATIAYGIRNLSDLTKGLEEIKRILKPGGILAILELTTPESKWMKKLHHLYLNTWIPFIGYFFGKNKIAYDHLSSSIKGFLTRDQLLSKMKQLEFEPIHIELFSQGCATLILCRSL